MGQEAGQPGLWEGKLCCPMHRMFRKKLGEVREERGGRRADAVKANERRKPNSDRMFPLQFAKTRRPMSSDGICQPANERTDKAIWAMAVHIL